MTLSRRSLSDCRKKMRRFKCDVGKDGVFVIRVPETLNDIVLELNKIGYLKVDDKGKITLPNL